MLNYQIRALAALGILAVLAACSDSSGPATPNISAPGGVTAVVTSASSVRLAWNVVVGADNYEVDRAEGATGTFSNIKTGLTSTFYEDTGLKSGTMYRYVVRAVDGTSKSGNSTEVHAQTTAEGPKIAMVTGIPLSRTFYSDTIYVLQGYVKVSNGATLTIQPGTKIVGDTLVGGSSLWILRGSKIVASGTASAPIVFTSQRTPGNRKPGDWGGIIIVGNAPINRTVTPIFTEGPTGAAENYAGGTNFDDNSGSLQYVRVEFAGYDVSNGGGQELNSISSYAVGRGTTYDYVQSMAGLDDSFESWGGSYDMRHMVSFESGDDHFDWTEGYQGRAQFLIALQTSVLQPRPGTGTVSSDPRGFEGDGCEIDKAGCTYANKPTSKPVWANFTLIGPGTGVFTATDGSGAVVRRGSGGYFVNGIIARWPGVGVSIRDAESGALFATNELYFRNIMLSENGSNFEGVANGRFGAMLADSATKWSLGTSTLATIFSGTLPTGSTNVIAANLNIVPTGAAATAGLTAFAGTPLAAVTGSYFGGSLSGTAYVGAVDPGAGPKWYEGWTNWVRN